MRAVLDRATNRGIFATARTDNSPAANLLESGGFEAVGAPFPSTRNEASLNLWVRPG